MRMKIETIKDVESKLRPPTPIRHSKELEATLKTMESKIAATLNSVKTGPKASAQTKQ